MISNNKNILVHFIGIGGIGMSGIAEILLSLGYHVTGSDIQTSPNTLKLERLGAKIFIGHNADNITDDVTVVVYSSAVKEDNPEMVVAKQKQIPIMRRAEMLAELMRLRQGIAVAGTHGKTTTTSMLATILAECKVDPTYVIGGIVRNLSGHAKVGRGEYLVAEADESDGTFLLLSPIMSIITNIDFDHMDHYHTKENELNAFEEFANKIPFYGKCAFNAHDEHLMDIASRMKKPWTTFSIFDEGVKAEFEARNLIQSPNGASYDLYIREEMKGTVKIAIPGRHNVLNSLGAIAIAVSMGLEISEIIKAISKFEGVGRRMQLLKTMEHTEVLDDYAHHPTEIASTLKAIRDTRKGREVIAIFQPHRFTRTRDCWTDFFHCFNDADKLYICPIYPASELPIDGINSEKLIDDINNVHPGFVKYLDDVHKLKDVVESDDGKDRTIICLGAGSIGRVSRDVLGV